MERGGPSPYCCLARQTQNERAAAQGRTRARTCITFRHPSVQLSRKVAGRKPRHASPMVSLAPADVAKRAPTMIAKPALRSKPFVQSRDCKVTRRAGTFQQAEFAENRGGTAKQKPCTDAGEMRHQTLQRHRAPIHPSSPRCPR